MRYITVFCRQIPRTRNDRQTALRASGDRNRCLRLFFCNFIITYLQSKCNGSNLFYYVRIVNIGIRCSAIQREFTPFVTLLKSIAICGFIFPMSFTGISISLWADLTKVWNSSLSRSPIRIEGAAIFAGSRIPFARIPDPSEIRKHFFRLPCETFYKTGIWIGSLPSARFCLRKAWLIWAARLHGQFAFSG